MSMISRTGLWLGLAGLVALLLAATVWSRAGVSTAQNTAPPGGRTIMVNGAGEANARPDQATVNLGTEVQAITAGDAQAQNAARINAVTQAVRGAGIPPESIQTSNVSLTPITRDRTRPEPVPSGPTAPGGPTASAEPGIVGYRAGATIRVKVAGVDQTGAIIDAAVKAGANEVQGIQFSIKDESGLRAQALTRAVADARARADALAGAVNGRVTGVETIVEAGAVVPPRPGPVAQAAAARAADAIAVEPGEQTVQAQVSVTFTY